MELHKYMELTTNYNNLTPYVMIAIGAGIVIIGSLGCCCTCKGKSGLLYLVNELHTVADTGGGGAQRSEGRSGFQKLKTKYIWAKICSRMLHLRP